MNIDTYRKCTNWNIGYRIDVLTPVFSIYRKPVWYSSRDVPNNNLEDVCQWLIKFTINSQFASSNSCLLSLSACHTWSHTCLDRARWSARRGRLLIHLPQAIPIPASAFNMNDCLLVTSSHGIRFKTPPPPPPPEGLKIVAVSGRTARRLVENIIAGTYKEPVRPYRLVYIFGGRKRPGAPGPQDHHPRQRFPAVGRHRVPGGVLWNLRAGRSCPVLGRGMGHSCVPYPARGSDATTNRCSRQQRHYYGPSWAERKACWCSSTSTPTGISWTESTWTRQATPCFVAGCWGSSHPTPTPGPF